MGNDKIKIILADKDESCRIIVKNEIKNSSNLTLVAESDNCIDLINLLEFHECNIIIFCSKLSGTGCFEMIRKFNKRNSEIKVISLYSIVSDKEVMNQAIAGVKGHVSKNIELEELEYAAKQVYKGIPYCSDSLLIEFNDDFIGYLFSLLYNLSNKESLILQLFAQGYSYD